ncbi:MmgE/PrpD family protein [Streptomyces sp. NBC_01446]|uniref:MmgE/PrpD family protein n=1 Tax=Streptomyces sp. NBC_01446 TaxID=2903870 RepID=UPI002258BE61|nr:MmgE/PrpD family protein [Streptomyces sp. NBC_01446]MCX4647040.1 MmgE/PrpD family protein [Streptomyces sp. NBC_01446]
MTHSTSVSDHPDELSSVLAEFAAEAVYEKLPQPAVDGAKKSLLDTLGVILAASGTEPAARAAVDVVRDASGQPQATVLGHGFRTSAVMAAFANGAMAHCLNFDDQTPWGQHSATSIVPAALAVVERQGGIPGKDLIAAVAVGQDLFTRLRRHVGWRQDWNLSSVIGVLAATATAGRLLNLPPDRLAHAFSFGAIQSGGFMDMVSGPGSELGGMYAGFSAKGGVLAALLAQRGAKGTDTLFEGKNGFFATYFGGSYDREKILENLGGDYYGAATLYKPWAAVGTAHSHIHATLEAMARHGLNSDDIQELRVYAGDCHEGLCAPLDARRAPATLMDARFSLPFLVAMAAVHGDLKAGDLTQAALKNDRVLDLARKVVTVSDPALDWKDELPSGRVGIVTRDGRRLEQSGEHTPGSATRPLTWTDIREKFANCAALAAVPPSPEQIAATQRAAADLESADDAAHLIRSLTETPNGH